MFAASILHPRRISATLLCVEIHHIAEDGKVRREPLSKLQKRIALAPARKAYQTPKQMLSTAATVCNP